MKQFITVVLLAATVAVSAMEDKGAMMNNVAAECKKIESASDADVDLIRKKTVPTSAEGKCLVGCMMEKMTVFVNGKFSKQNSERVCQDVYKDNPEMLKKAKEAHEHCDKIMDTAGSDKCVNGPVLLDCIFKHMPEFQILPPN